MGCRKYKRILLGALLLVFFGVTPTTLSASDKDIVKVGYYEDGAYMHRNQRGEYVGYNSEFWQEIAKRADIKYKMVDTGNLEHALTMQKQGEIDIIPALYYTDERAQDRLYSAHSVGNINVTLYVRMHDNRYDYEDFNAFKGMRTGVLRGGDEEKSFRNYCDQHHLEVETLEYDTVDQILHALDNKEIDAAALSHLGKDSGYKSVAEFAPKPVYVTVSNARPDILAKIDKAMNDLLLSNPGYMMDLYDKYFAPGVSQKPTFTKAEKQYIHASGTLDIAFDYALPPLSYEEKGEFKGVASDIIDYISKCSGLSFQYQACTQEEAIRQLRKGKLQLAFSSDGDYLWDDRNHLNSTLYYLRMPTALITKESNKTVKKVALPLGYYLSERVAQDNYDKDIVYYATAKECFDAVERGEADVTYTNSQTANYLTEHLLYKNFRSTLLNQYTNEFCIGVSQSADPRLLSIINKCLQYLPREQVDEFLIENSSDQNNMTVQEFVKKNLVVVVGFTVIILGVILLLTFYYLSNVLRSNKRIRRLLYKDDLTNLDNLNGFYKNWDKLSGMGKKQEYALLCCDIVQFKLINDSFGYTVGDTVLCIFAEYLQKIMQSEEYCARVSADNFAALFQYEDWGKLMGRLEKVCRNVDIWRVEETRIPYKINIVFGVYLVDWEEDTDVHKVIDLASYAKHSAKLTSDKTAVLYDEKMRMEALYVQELEGRLDIALKQDEFVTYYQPKVEMKSGRVVGSEALIRWSHPVHGILMPGVFIPVFEKKGTIRRVDLWLYEDVCKTIREWLNQGLEVTPVSCNFSRNHFAHPDFPDQIAWIADLWQVPHELLEVEITESAIVDEQGNISITMLRLKEKGFHVAIDDFGAGYSSLGQLQQMVADVLKLDKSFLSHGLQGAREQIIVENLVNMAGELGMTVICEGVETGTQAEILQKIGCNFAQGYYYYKPMPREEFETLCTPVNDVMKD